MSEEITEAEAREILAEADASDRPAGAHPLDGEIVEPGGEMVVARASREVLVPLDPDAVVAGMEAYQSLLPRLLDDGDYQTFTERGETKRFVKKSGWRKIARAFNLTVTIVPGSLRVDRDEDGNAIRAECVARALAPNGVAQDADGYCSISEKRFEGWRQGRGENSKIENDLRATATTRAKNRAISDLVGMGEPSAEEIDGGGGKGGPPFGPPAEDPGTASRALAEIVGDDDVAREAWGEIKTAAGGYLPAIVATALVRTRVAIERNIDGSRAATFPPSSRRRS